MYLSLSLLELILTCFSVRAFVEADPHTTPYCTMLLGTAPGKVLSVVPMLCPPRLSTLRDVCFSVQVAGYRI